MVTKSQLLEVYRDVLKTGIRPNGVGVATRQSGTVSTFKVKNSKSITHELAIALSNELIEEDDDYVVMSKDYNSIAGAELFL